MVESSEESGALINLGESVTIRNIQTFHQQISAALKQTHPITIDASTLKKIDTTGAQLLYLLHETTTKNNLKINWLCADKPINEQLKLLGITIPPLMQNVEG